MSEPLIDIGVNLTSKQFRQDLPKVLELDRGELYKYTGGYKDFLEKRAPKALHKG